MKRRALSPYLLPLAFAGKLSSWYRPFLSALDRICHASPRARTAVAGRTVVISAYGVCAPAVIYRPYSPIDTLVRLYLRAPIELKALNSCRAPCRPRAQRPTPLYRNSMQRSGGMPHACGRATCDLQHHERDGAKTFTTTHRHCCLRRTRMRAAYHISCLSPHLRWRQASTARIARIPQQADALHLTWDCHSGDTGAGRLPDLALRSRATLKARARLSIPAIAVPLYARRAYVVANI